jgi:cytochrome oxidase Cu insertion factor (SCO1/SenC/PrrC family)
MSGLDGATPVADIVAYVDRVRALPGSGDDLVELLAEQSPIYAGRSTNEAERLRGYLLASFELTGLPVSAMAFVIEELENGLNPYVVAAAAKAVRGGGNPSSLPGRIAPLLLDAIDRIRQSDDLVCFDGCAVPAGGASSTTALMELFRTVAWLGPHAGTALPALQAMLEREPPAFSRAMLADIEKAIVAVSAVAQTVVHSCCAGRSAPIASAPSAEVDIDRVELQDQEGAVFTFRDFFSERPSVLTFFYTRCMNPNKCSLTITKLARLQRRICEEGIYGQVNIAAITYDPEYDLPRRLRAYGADRGMSFDDRNRLLRTTGPFQLLQRRFDLGVGYGPTTVNRHRLDFVVLDGKGCLGMSSSRIQWDEEEVLGALKSALKLSH